MKIKIIILTLSMFTTLSFAQQNLYKCTNKGKTTYSNDENDNKCQLIELKEVKEINRFNVPKNNTKETTKENSINEYEKKEQEIPPIPQNKISKSYIDSVSSVLKMLGLK